MRVEGSREGLTDASLCVRVVGLNDHRVTGTTLSATCSLWRRQAAPARAQRAWLGGAACAVWESALTRLSTAPNGRGSPRKNP